MGLFSKLFSPKVDYNQLIKEKNAVVIDVRSKGEFKSGHGKNAMNIPLNEFSGKVKDIVKLNKPIILVCQSGIRASQAKRMLAETGVEVYNAKSWTKVR